MRKPFVIAAAAVLAATPLVLGPSGSTASSHREAPLIAMDPAADNTDLYAFVSPDRPGYVTMIANWAPFSDPDGGPNFFPFATDVSYLLNVDNDGDNVPDARFRFKFQNIDKRGNNTFLYNNGPVTTIDDENLLFRQTYSIESSFNDEPWKVRVTGVNVAPSRVGNASMPDYNALRTSAIITLPGGWRTFAGQADDPFFLDLRVFDLLYGGDLSETGRDTLAGYNVNTIALEVPFKDVALNEDGTRNPVVGIWTTTERAAVRMTGQTGAAPDNNGVQVSRLGNPLVNEVVVPAGLKDAFNASRPDQDAGNAAIVARVTDPEVARLLEAIYKIPAPATPRDDLVEIFLTGITTKANGPIKADLNSQLMNMDIDPSKFKPAEMLRLNLGVLQTATPNRLGVIAGDLQGYPNGRRLSDDVVDIALQAVAGAALTGKLVDALATGDKVDVNDNAFGTTFPYVALPNVTKGSSAASSGNTSSGNTTDPATTPSVAPKANTIMGMDTSDTVAILSSSVAAGMGVLLFLGWWRRRNTTNATTTGE